MRENIQNILACPVCGETKIRLTEYKCDSCGSSFFELNGIPCFFPSGGNQLQLWNHLLATFIEEGEATRNELEAEINKRTISSLTKQRLKATLHIHNESHTHLVKILRQAGLQPHINPSYQHYSTKVFSKYHELALRDWAWFARQETNFSYGDRLHDENQIALNTILKVMKSTEQKKRTISSRILVIGAGAGRLSWDLHCALQPSMTIALDFNPLLSYVSKSLVRDKKNIEWHEKIDFPHNQLPSLHKWQLECMEVESGLHQSWFPFLADAWAMPFAPHCFDYVITPWFIDVMNRDCKQIISQVDTMLKPQGHWINYGPFLYNENLPESVKYTSTEIKELLTLSHFKIISDATLQTPYTCSPLNKSGRIEQVWCMAAQSPPDRKHIENPGQFTGPINAEQLPPWLVMPHLPIPRLTNTRSIPEPLNNIANLIDGQHSINEIISYLTPLLPEEYDAEKVLYDFLFEYFVK